MKHFGWIILILIQVVAFLIGSYLIRPETWLPGAPLVVILSFQWMIGFVATLVLAWLIWTFISIPLVLKDCAGRIERLIKRPESEHKDFTSGHT